MTVDLTDDQLRAVFRQEIQPDIDAVTSDAQQSFSLLIVVGGQPGAGKSRSIERIAVQHPGIVSIIGDDFRLYHPDYDRLIREAPFDMPAATAQAAGRWVSMAIDYLRMQHRSTLLETTLRQPAVVQRTFTDFRRSGYTTELHVLAVPPQLSRLGTVSRYLAQLREDGVGRWTPSAMHDAADHALPGAVDKLIGSGAVDYVRVENRRGETHFRARVDSDQRLRVAQAAKRALDAARDPQQLSTSEALAWCETAVNVVQTCIRSRQSNPDLLATLARLVHRDAPLVLAAAYPNDQRRQQESLKMLRSQLSP